MNAAASYDYDWLVIGSGFGGSVAALRLAEKGHRVAVLECGRRFRDDEFAKTTWQASRYYWMPRLGLKGIFRLTPFKDVFIASGCGVGGGSLGYANTLYRARPAFFQNPQWAGLEKWEETLAPHYQTAEHMLGVAPVEFESDGDRLMQDLGRHFGVEDTYTHTNVGVFFGEPGREVDDPYFGGEGPRRSGCIRCGACMIGCRHGAKNTLVKNYLWFAERRGARVQAERTVTEIRPQGAADGSDGYVVTHERSGAWWRKDVQRITARGVVVAAGALGTNQLLASCKHGGALPRLSDRLGELVRTNSESILAVTVPAGGADFTRSVAISSSIYPNPDTHIEFVTNGQGGDSQSLLYTLLTGEGTRATRPLRWAAAVIRHPLRMLRGIWPFGWSKRTVVLLVMQALDNAISFRARPKWFGKGVRLSTEQDPEKPNPTFIPVANEAAEWIANRLGGIALSSTMEALFNVPATAHILGGAVIGADASRGVIDAQSRAFGYQNLLVCDGAAMPANPGVNPSLTITALAEHAMSFVPLAQGGLR